MMARRRLRSRKLPMTMVGTQKSHVDAENASRVKLIVRAQSSSVMARKRL
jgi:hypothetical protein